MTNIKKTMLSINSRPLGWKQSFYDVLRMLNFRCVCGTRNLHVKDDDDIICENCKREFDITLSLRN